MPGLEIALVFLATAALVVAGDATLRRAGRRARTLRTLGVERPVDGRAGDWLVGLGRIGVPQDSDERTERLEALRAAGWSGPEVLERFTGIRLAAALGLGLPALLVALAVGNANLLALALASFGVGYMAPILVLRAIAQRRRESIVKELPDVLDLVLVAMEGGHGFDAAASRASHELVRVAPVFTSELRRTLGEIASGLPRERALESLRERCATPAIDAVVTVLLQSAHYGTDVSEALRRHAASMRIERRQRAHEQGARTPVRITFPMILFILPALLLIVVGPGILRLLERFQ